MLRKVSTLLLFYDMLWKINEILWFVFWLRVRVLWFHANSEAKVNEGEQRYLD